MVNHNGYVARVNSSIPTIKGRNNNDIFQKLRVSLLHCQLKEPVNVWDEDRFSHLKKFSLVTLNV